MIRSALMLLAAFVIASPAVAGETGQAPLVKGTKFYQSRQITEDVSEKIQSIEPAAGVETSGEIENSSQLIAPPVEDEAPKGKTPMKLHGKK